MAERIEFRLRNPVFVGRRRELEELERTLLTDSWVRLVAVVGEAGSGKTTLLRCFAGQAQRELGGRVFGRGSIVHELPLAPLKQELPPHFSEPCLLIIDDLDQFSRSERKRLVEFAASNPELRVLFGSRSLPEPDIAVHANRLGPMTRQEFEELFRWESMLRSPDEVAKLYERVGGNALMAAVAGATIRDGLMTWERFFRSLENFDGPVLFGPDGQPIETNGDLASSLRIHIVAANDELMDALKINPELLRDLPPRRFEEIVANILARQGYQVELTPASGDGGFDIYAAKSETLGRFLYLVECKRYAPLRKWGCASCASFMAWFRQRAPMPELSSQLLTSLQGHRSSAIRSNTGCTSRITLQSGIGSMHGSDRAAAA